MRTRLLLLLILMALVLVACGGTGESSDDPNSPDNGTIDQQDSNDNGNPGEVSSDDFDVPDIDPAAMPPEGQAVVDVDGKTFAFEETDFENRLFTCEIRDNGISVNFQDEGHDLFLSGATQTDGSILASTTINPKGENFRYDSTNGGGRGGGVAIDGNHILFVGQFDSTPLDDPSDISDVGEGSIAVTCP